MDDTQTTSPATNDIAAAQTPTSESTPNVPAETPSGPPGFSERGRMRRRIRFLRKARELAYRDLGGLVFDLHRFGRRNDALVLAKLETIGRIDTELRALEATLAERRPVTVLREAGVAACPRCAAIHGSDDRFCPNCGLAMDLRAERPMAGPQTTAPTPPAPTPPPAPMPTAAVPAPAASPAPSRTAAPATTTPAPSAPNPTATPVPAHTPPRTAVPAPEQGVTAPSKPAPASAGDPAPAETRPNVEEPTEIVRPPVKDP